MGGEASEHLLTPGAVCTLQLVWRREGRDWWAEGERKGRREELGGGGRERRRDEESEREKRRRSFLLYLRGIEEDRRMWKSIMEWGMQDGDQNGGGGIDGMEGRESEGMVRCRTRNGKDG